MGVSIATLGTSSARGRVLDARMAIPAWGASWHDVTVEGELALAGAVTLTVADLTISGTILAGGVGQGRSFYRLVSGAGGWGKSLPRRSYANDAGVKLGTVLGDAAQSVGETLDTSTFDPSARLGPAFTRPAGPARRLLEQLSPGAWYVGEDGKTRLGARAATKLTTKFSQTSQLDLARGTATIASDTLAPILPGLSVLGLNVVDVEHEFSIKSGLRSKLWGQRSGGSSRRLTALRALIDQLDPARQFRGVFEYRIVTQSGERLNLQPVRVSTGMPDLQRVFVRPGIPGAKASHAIGARVVVGFLDGDPAQPYVHSFEDAEGSGWDPHTLTLGGTSLGTAVPTAVGQAARVGDQAGPWSITRGSSKVTIGG